MLKYQLGSATIAGETRLILSVQETLFDLAALWQHAQRVGVPARVTEALPDALLPIIQRWDYWRETLPHIAAYAVAQRDQPGSVAPLNAAEVRWRPPITYPNKLICLGANYVDHNREMGFAGRPDYPYTFLKPATTTLVGSGAAVALPEDGPHG